jgi:hypothetical protein
MELEHTPLGRARSAADESLSRLIAVREALEYPRSLTAADDAFAEAAHLARKASAAAEAAPAYYMDRAPSFALSFSLHCRAYAAAAKANAEAAHAAIMFSIAEESEARLRDARIALALAEAAAKEDRAYSDGASATAARVRGEADAAAETAREATEDQALADRV